MSSEDRNSILDYEEVLRVLSESFQEVWKDNPDVLVYLAELGSLGIHRLVQEPDRLAEEKISVLEQTQDLAFHNYKTFIQAAECSQKIFQDFNIIESRLDSLVNKLPVFKQKCGEFGKEAQQINARWKQASSTLAKHQQLLEFLEMPQLMDNYVKAGYYDEALELSSYVKRLERKNSDIPLIKSIISDIQNAANTMLVQLLAKLQTNIQLPECLKIVGYLRRMDVFNETELRLKFLQARDTWFKKVISEIDNSDPYQHVIKVIENSRIHLFDIITQYRAIFSDDDPMLLVHDTTKSNCAIFHSWMTMKIAWFLQTLEIDLHLNLGGRIDSVFAQCMYFGLSFSRVNIDFRPLLIPIFLNAVFRKFQTDIKLSTQKFEIAISKYLFSSYSNTSLLVPVLSDDSLQPPNCLLDFQPLAQYCNDVLNALNDLKLCCSYSLCDDIIKVLTDSLEKIVKTLLSTYHYRGLSANEQEKEHFARFCYLLSSELIPHFNKCLSVLFSPDNISQILEITSMEFKKFEHLCRLNPEAITKPLEIVMPVKDNIEENEDVGIVMNFKSDNVVPSNSQISPTPTEILNKNEFLLEKETVVNQAEEESLTFSADEETKASSAGEETKASSAGEETKVSSADEETKVSSAGEETKGSSADEETKPSSAGEESKIHSDDVEAKDISTGESAEIDFEGVESKSTHSQNNNVNSEDGRLPESLTDVSVADTDSLKNADFSCNVVTEIEDTNLTE